MGWQIRMTAAEAGADQATYAIEDNLGYLVNRTARLIAQLFSGRLRRHDVALGQWAILLFLYAEDGQTQRELSRVVAIEPPTVARTIDRMVRDGLVRREPDPRDGRATRIRPDDLRQLSVPTLMIWGDSDPVVPIEAARAAAQLIPDARLEVLPAGHVPWLGHPEQVAELLTAFARG